MTSRRRFARPYVLTAGRTVPVGDTVDPDARAVTIGPAWEFGRHVTPEDFEIAELCRTPQSLSEIAHRLQVPIGVARVLVADLVAGATVEFLR